MRQTSIADLRQETPRRVRVFFDGPAPEPPPALAAALTRRDPRRWDLEWRGPLGRALDALRGLGVADIEIEPFRLEEYVLGIYADGSGPRNEDARRARRPLAATARRPDRRARRRAPGIPGPARRHRAQPSARGLFSQLSALRAAGIPGSLRRIVIASFSGSRPSASSIRSSCSRSVAGRSIWRASSRATWTKDWSISSRRAGARRSDRHAMAVVSGGVTALIVALMFLANRAALAWLAPPGSPRPRTSAMLWVAANLFAVAWCFGAAGLALAADVRRRATAVGAIGAGRGRPVSPALRRGIVGAGAPLRARSPSTTTKACAR